MGRAGCGVPRVCSMQADSREASETGPPPLRADVITAFTRVFDALWSSQTVKPRLLHPAPARSHKSRGGAPRGERPTSLDARRQQRVHARVERAAQKRL